MKTRFPVVIVAALSVGILLTGCGTAAIPAEENPVADIPITSYLYLGTDEALLMEPATGYVTTTHYISGGSSTDVWGMRAAEGVLADTFSYSFLMASAGTSQVSLEVALVHSGEETVLVEDAFVIASDLFQPYVGEMAVSDAVLSQEDEIILRMTVSGSDYGIRFGGLNSYISLIAPPEVDEAVLEQRTAALTWLANHIALESEEGVLSTDLFNNTKSQLDYVILSGADASWIVGWGLTDSGEPYRLDWIDGAFSAVEITMDEALELDTDEMQVSFEIDS
ncbi:MAG: hypothetical protein JXA97_10675 [Anaerolineales bacterium]|nr:hypothetical protein [Anaerolineales bacterium]